MSKKKRGKKGRQVNVLSNNEFHLSDNPKWVGALVAFLLSMLGYLVLK